MSFNFRPSFKAKLNIAIFIALLGFALIAFISLKAVMNLNTAAGRVDELRQSIELLQKLQVDVLHLKGTTDNRRFIKLQEVYTTELIALSDRSVTEVVVNIESINDALHSWVSGEQQLIDTQSKIGLSFDEGLRGETAESIKALNQDLFEIFRKSADKLKQSIDVFVAKRDQNSYQSLELAIDAVRQAGADFSFESFIEPRLAVVSAATQALSSAIFQGRDQSKQVKQSYQNLAEGVEQASMLFEQQLSQAKQENVSASDSAINIVLGFSIVVALLVTILLIGTSRALVKTLSEMSAVLAKLGQGDLTHLAKTDKKRNDELDNVGESVNKMTSSMNSVLCSVSETCEFLDSGAKDLHGSLEDMISGNKSTNIQAESIASAVEHISVTMADMSSSVNNTLEQANLAEQSAQQGGVVINHALDSFSNLGEVFDSLNVQLSVLEKESIKIDGVTDIIHSLAGQTNLLALNAAIEAARAGDAGRGFSVVATEVRNLAEETVKSTQSISEIINAMQNCIKEIVKEMKLGNNHVATGRKLSDDATSAISNIKSLVLEVSEQSGELTSSIDDANNATQSIAQNMENLASNVSINTEKSLTVNSYVGIVSGQTTELLDKIGKFTLVKS